MEKLLRKFQGRKCRIVKVGQDFFYSAYDVAEMLEFDNPRREVFLNSILEKYTIKTSRLIEWDDRTSELFVVGEYFIIDMALRADHEVSKSFIAWMLSLHEHEARRMIAQHVLEQKDNNNQKEKGPNVTVTHIGHKYGFSAKALNQFLFRHGIQSKKDGRWTLNDPYKNRNFTHDAIYKKDKRFMYWTPEGEDFIEKLLIAYGHKPIFEKYYQMTFI